MLKSIVFWFEMYFELEGNGPIDECATVAEVSVANFKFIFEISNLNKFGTN